MNGCSEHIDEVIPSETTSFPVASLQRLWYSTTLRLIPGVLGNTQSVMHESFSDGLLEHPHYTRPSVAENAYLTSYSVDIMHALKHGVVAPH